MELFQHEQLWVGLLPSPFGVLEVLCGEGAEPDQGQLLFIERLCREAPDALGQVRRSGFRLPFLWRPIRLAFNDEGRLLVQFQRRFLGKRVGLFLDEHCAFSLRLADIREESA